jgi:uncharacterized membrane protein YqiK
MGAKKIILLAMIATILALFVWFSWAMHQQTVQEEEATARAQAEQQKWVAEHPKEAAAQAKAQVEAQKAQAEAQKVAQADAIKKQGQRLLAAHAAVELKDAMKDPDSFKLLSVLLMKDGSVCYDYSATNTFGGRMKEYAVLTPKGKILINQAEVFNKLCANKTGEELLASAE